MWLHIRVNPDSIYLFSVDGERGGLRKIYCSVFFLPTLWFPGMEFRSSGLAGQVSLLDELSWCTHRRAFFSEALASLNTPRTLTKLLW